MEEVVLNAEKRNVVGKQVRALRRQGKLPAVIYGHGIEPLIISLNQREASRILLSLSASHLVVIKVDDQPHTTMGREQLFEPRFIRYLMKNFKGKCYYTKEEWDILRKI